MEKIRVWERFMIRGLAKKSICFVVVLIFGLFPFYSFTQEDLIATAKSLKQTPPDTFADSIISKAYLDIVAYYFSEINLDSAWKYLEVGQDFAKRSNSEYLLNDAQLYFISYYTYTGNLDTAIVLSENLIKTKPNDWFLISVYSNLGTAYYYKGEYLNALDFYLKGLKIEEAKSTEELNISYSNIANLYNQIGDNEKAIEYFRKCYRIEKEKKDTLNLYDGFLNFNNVYSSVKNFDSADFYLEKALQFRNFIEVDFYDEILIFHQAMFHARQKNYPLAISLIDSSRKSALADKDYYKFSNLSSHLTRLYNETGKYNKAKNIGLKALQIAQQNELTSILKFLNGHLAVAEENLGNYKAALDYHKQFKILEDSLNEKQKNQSIDRLKFLREKQEKNAKSAEVAIAIKEKQLANTNYYFQRDISWIIGLGLLILSLLLLMLYRSYGKNQNVLAELQTSQELIKSKSIELESYNKRLVELNDIKNKLLSLLAHDLRSPILGIVTSINLIQEEAFTKEEMDEILNEISASASANLDGIDNLVDWAHSQMDGLEQDKIETCAERVYEELQLELSGLLNAKEINLSFDKTGNDKIFVDYEMLKSSIRNLVTNAIKFSEPGKAVAITSEEKGDVVVVKIADRAGGIPKQLHNSIFEGPITSSPGTKGEKGSGIGLMLVKEFVSLNGGNISFETEEGLGTTFIMKFKKVLNQ